MERPLIFCIFWVFLYTLLTTICLSKVVSIHQTLTDYDSDVSYATAGSLKCQKEMQ